MFMLIMGILVISAAGGAVYMYSRAEKPIAAEICSELGLYEYKSNKDKIPFYKWAWDQENENRITAERIVRFAFENAKVWIDHEDRIFFRERCSLHQAGSRIDEAEIAARVERIVARTESLYQTIGEQVENALSGVLTIGEQEARERLKQAGILADSGAGGQKYCSIEIRRLLNRIGLEVMGGGSGIPLKDPSTGRDCFLQGLDVWDHCLHAIRNAIAKLVESRKFAANPKIIITLKSSIERGVIADFEEDVLQARKFRSALRTLIDKKQINLTYDVVEQCDSIFYGWKFSKRISFKQADHDRMRKMLVNEELLPCFRELAIQALSDSPESLGRFLDQFPRCVIFYGSQSKARAFAVLNYSNHLKALFDAAARPANRMSDPPLLLEITEETIQQYRNQAMDFTKTNAFSHLSGVRERAADLTLDKLLDKQQRLLALDHQIPDDSIEQRGWLINLPFPEMEPPEFVELESSKYNRYICFYCDTSSKSDFDSESDSARKKRLQFSARLFDALLGNPVNLSQKSVEDSASQ